MRIGGRRRDGGTAEREGGEEEGKEALEDVAASRTVIDTQPVINVIVVGEQLQWN